MNVLRICSSILLVLTTTVLLILAACQQTSTPTAPVVGKSIAPKTAEDENDDDDDDDDDDRGGGTQGGFVSRVTNPYFPLAPGTVCTYEGEADGTPEVDRVHVTRQTKRILGVECTVVADSVFADGELAEATFDWYAQDKAGNVWYFGEDSKEIENGQVVNTEGSWQAGVDGPGPGS